MAGVFYWPNTNTFDSVKRTIILVFLLQAVFVRAQNYIDLLRFHYNNTPPTSFDTGRGHSQISESGIDATVPLVLNPRTTFLTGLAGEQIQLQMAPGAKDITSLFTTLLKLGFNRKHSNTWTGTYILMPKLSSDLLGISDKDFQMGAYVLFTKEKHPDLKYRYGLYANTELFSPFVVPVIGMWYASPSKKLSLDLALPIFGNLDYRLNKWLSTGITFNAFVRSYYLRSDNGAMPTEYYVMKSTNEALGYIQIYLTKNILLQTKAGVTVGRYYRIYDLHDRADFSISLFRIGDQRKPLNVDLKDDLMFQMRLIYRFHLPEKIKEE